MSFAKTISLTVVAAAASTLMLGAPAWSQTSSSSGPGTGSTGMMGGTGSGSANTARGAQGTESKVARGDASMLKDLAQNNMGEIDAGKLALEKSQSTEVKAFAQMMIDDHTKALGEVTTLAQSKGVVLPDGPGAMAKTKATAMKAVSGNMFDKEYAKHAGIGDHERTVKLLRKIQKDAKDADLKALASKMLPTVEGHLAKARDLAAMKAPAKS